MSRSVSAPSSVTKTSPCWNGLIVPGSTLMYGSNFWIVTDSPRATSNRPREAAAMPFPSAETTPPVTKMKRVSGRLSDIKSLGSPVYSPDRRTTRRPSGGREQLLGVAAGGRVGRLGAEHPAQLGHDSVALERLDGGERGVGLGGLLDPEMARREGGDLRQVRDAEDLAGVAERPEPLADRTRRLPAHASVDLVEHQRARLAGARHRHQREHHARELASGGGVANRSRRHARVGREQELDPLGAGRADLFLNVHLDLESGTLHGEGGQLFLHPLRELRRCLFSRCRNSLSQL